MYNTKQRKGSFQTKIDYRIILLKYRDRIELNNKEIQLLSMIYTDLKLAILTHDANIEIYNQRLTAKEVIKKIEQKFSIKK